MTSVAQTVRRAGNLAPTFELLAAGHTRHTVAAAVRRGEIVRVRQGWYASRGIHQTAIEAVRVGGRATCLTGLELQGVWTAPHRDLHVLLPRGAARPRTPRDMRRRHVEDPRGVRLHWTDAHPRRSFVASGLQCLADLVTCVAPDLAFASADSLLRLLPPRPDAWATFTADLSSSYAVLREADGICESGIESLWWMRMRRHRIPIRRQVHIASVGRVDFLIGDRLVVEVDGAQYHSDPVAFEADRRRDAASSSRGYRVLRFSYRQVMFEWTEVESAVLAAVIRGDHW